MEVDKIQNLIIKVCFWSESLEVMEKKQGKIDLKTMIQEEHTALMAARMYKKDTVRELGEAITERVLTDKTFTQRLLEISKL